ncbi:uncharacterized protein LOC125941069 [Dermacentor silvarum]|uniref:uncharacterized protein LOC125941069 n=1 Tax=Dermacentor silvarum TaxID=543639 RepID=UPI002100CF7D|nr:uncharacterized protein LOC125941069 [Dermacentor silvarum]
MHFTIRVRQGYFNSTFVNVNDTWVIPFLPAWIYLNGTVKRLERRMLIGDLNTVTKIGYFEQGALLPFYNVASLSRTLYDSQLWSLLFALLDSPEFAAVPTLNRASLQQDLGAFLRNGDVGLTLYIAGIRYIWRETSRAVWRAFAKEYREIRKMAAQVPLAQLDGLVYNITSWHRPLNTTLDNVTAFDRDTQPFVEEVLCLGSPERRTANSTTLVSTSGASTYERRSFKCSARRETLGDGPHFLKKEWLFF